ncbi:TPA: hypothetical protein ACPJ0F_004726 [Vibrio diabolicus]
MNYIKHYQALMASVSLTVIATPSYALTDKEDVIKRVDRIKEGLNKKVTNSTDFLVGLDYMSLTKEEKILISWNNWGNNWGNNWVNWNDWNDWNDWNNWVNWNDFSNFNWGNR